MLEISNETKTSRVPVTIMRLEGDIDSLSFQSFQTKVEELLTDGADHFLLDFARVNRISSAGLRVIHNLFNKLRERHKDVNDDELRKRMSAGAYKSPHLKVVNLSAVVAEVFQLGGFDIYIEQCKDEESGLASF